MHQAAFISDIETNYATLDVFIIFFFLVFLSYFLGVFPVVI